MRGKVRFLGEYAGHVGITPACAGKSEEDSLGEALVWDHPRVCGEKVIPVVFEPLEVGITPAYAGKRLPG